MKERFSLDCSTSQGGYEENYDFVREFDSRAVEIELMGLTLETTVSQPPSQHRHFSETLPLGILSL